MAKCIYPGSFDPITLGHVDIIKRIAKLYDEVIVLVANTPNKKYLFPPEERVSLVKESLGQLNNVKIDVFNGLTVDYARSQKVNVIVRGLRVVSDFEYEMSMANVNNLLEANIETVIVLTRPEFSFISSRLVKEVAQFGGQLEKLVPAPVASAMQSKY